MVRPDVNHPPPPSRPGPAPSRAVLEAKLAALEAEREVVIRQKRRNLLLFGAAISLLVHVGILWYLDSIRQRNQPGQQGDSSFIEFAVLPEQELTHLEQIDLEVETPDSLSDLSEIPNVDAELDLETPPVAELNLAADGSQATLGGGAAGGDGSMNLGGTGTGVKFFTAEGRGTRFAFIIDVSGSMGESRKLRTALAELARSVDSLPDFAYFHVLLFHSEVVRPQWQQGWQRARAREVTRLVNWLDRIKPGGGTQPIPAFARALSLDVPPDVIFFLTDGQIPQDSPMLIADMNRRGGGVVINTIAFGDPRSQNLLKKISEDSGGMYRFIPVGGPRQ